MKYTISEMEKIIKAAKEMGANGVTLEGLAFSFAATNPTSINQNDGVFKTRQSTPRKENACSACRSTDMRPSEFGKGDYCYSCYLRRKEERESKRY